jgi:hypothetical protein
MKLLALILLCFPAWALSNAVTIHATTEVPSGQVHRVARWFAHGEIAGYPQPFVSNVAATEWQVDVKNRWPDGTVRYAIIHFPAAIPTSGSIVVDFRNSANACHLGNQANCEAAALDGAGMLASNGGGWDAEIEATADPAGSTTALTANARTMLTAGHFTYWIRGPLVTAVIAEDASAARIYDGGWSGPGCTAPYSTCTWSDDTTYRSLHPMFVLTFNQNANVRIEYIMANYWTTARQDQRYSIALKTSAGTVFSKTGIHGISNTWWRKEFWDGDAPVQTNIDFNMAYMRYSRMILPYRLGVTVPLTNVPSGSHNITSTVNSFSSTSDSNYPFFCTPGSGMCSGRLSYYPNVGGRADRGFYPLWEAHWLYSMRRDVFDVVVGAAVALGSQYTHHREAGTGLANYHGSTPALGLPVSINTRTTYSATSGGTGGLPAAVGPVSTSRTIWRGWEIDAHHRHSHAQLAYLITGDWWFMQEQSFLAHVIFGWGDPFYGLTGSQTFARRSPWGQTGPEGANHRGLGWQVWNIWSASFIVPDADPQSAYLKEKMRDVVAQFEGYYDVRDGDYYQPCTTDPFDTSTEQSKWCYARNVYGQGRPTHLKFTPVRGSTASQVPPIDSWTSGWMSNYVRMAWFAMCHGEGLGCGIAKHHADGYNLAASAPGANPSVLQVYTHTLTLSNSTTLTAELANSQSATTIPVTDASVCAEPLPFMVQIGNEAIWVVGKSGNNLIAGTTTRGGRAYLSTSRATHAAGATVNCPRQPVDWAELTSITDGKEAVLVPHTSHAGDSSYKPLMCAGGRWSEDFSRSRRASEVFDANCHDSSNDGFSSMYSSFSDPRWLFEAYRAIDRVRVTVASGTATLQYVAPSGAACRVHVGASAPATSDDSGDPSDTVNGRLHSYSATGLNVGTHHYRISCGPARATGTFVVE